MRPSSFRIILLCLFLPASALCISTNNNLLIGFPPEPVDFLQESSLQFIDPAAEEILRVEISNQDFLRYSLDIRVSNRISNQVTITFKSYEISNFLFPAILFHALQQGRTNVYYSPALILPATNSYGPVQAPGPLLDIFPIRNLAWLWLLLLLPLGGAVYLLIRRFTRPRGTRALVRKKDPWQHLEQALQEMPLDSLSDSSLRPYFELVSVEVRRFLEQTLRIPALEYSSREIRQVLRRESVSQEMQEIIQHILQMCDRVKYARHEPVREQAFSVTEEILSLMFRTAVLLGTAYDHGLSDVLTELQHLEEEYRQTPDSRLLQDLNTLLQDYLARFYFLQPGPETLTMIKLPQNMDIVWQELPDSAAPQIFTRAQELVTRLAEYYGCPRPSQPADTGLQQEA